MDDGGFVSVGSSPASSEEGLRVSLTVRQSLCGWGCLCITFWTNYIVQRKCRNLKVHCSWMVLGAARTLPVIWLHYSWKSKGHGPILHYLWLWIAKHGFTHLEHLWVLNDSILQQVVFDNESLTMKWVLDNVIVGMQCQLLQTGSCRQEMSRGHQLCYRSSWTSTNPLQTATCTPTLLELQTYFDPYVRFDVDVRSYLGLLAPAFVVALVLQATNAQVGRVSLLSYHHW